MSNYALEKLRTVKRRHKMIIDEVCYDMLVNLRYDQKLSYNPVHRIKNLTSVDCKVSKFILKYINLGEQPTKNYVHD